MNTMNDENKNQSFVDENAMFRCPLDRSPPKYQENIKTLKKQSADEDAAFEKIKAAYKEKQMENRKIIEELKTKLESCQKASEDKKKENENALNELTRSCEEINSLRMKTEDLCLQKKKIEADILELLDGAENEINLLESEGDDMWKIITESHGVENDWQTSWLENRNLERKVAAGASLVAEVEKQCQEVAELKELECKSLQHDFESAEYTHEKISVDGNENLPGTENIH